MNANKKTMRNTKAAAFGSVMPILALVIGFLLFIPSGASDAATPKPTALKFETYNICITEPWCSNAKGSQALKTRTKNVYKRVKASKPAVLAIQEGSGLFNGVTNLAYTSKGQAKPKVTASKRDKALGASSKYFTKAKTGVAYKVAFNPAATASGLGLYVNTAKVSFVTAGGKPEVRTVRIGTDPEVASTPAIERKTARYAIFVHLKDRATGKDFWVGNVHTSDGSKTEELAERANQARKVGAAIKSFGNTPVVMLGDFNEARTASKDRILAGMSGMVDSQSVAKKKSNVKYNSYQGWSKTKPRKTGGALGTHLDRVLVSNGDWNVSKWATAGPLTKKKKWSYAASDHIPVVVVATLR